VTAGQTATFSVGANGTAPLYYQWRKGSVAIGNATNASYTTPGTVLGDNGALFSVVVTNVAGSVTSANATLTVNPVVSTFVLTVVTNGNGTVTLNPAGGSYASNTVVTLTANPAADTTFAGWSGALSGVANPATLTMTGNRSVQATFTLRPQPYMFWGHKALIQFAGYSPTEVLTNFPALVMLGTNISGFAYSQFLSGSNDLRFTDVSGCTNLNFEIEKWDTADKSPVWVQVPVFSNHTTIVAWWGAAGQSAPACATNGATWDATFKGVWHLGNLANPFDSTTNANSGIDYGATTAPGMVGNAGALVEPDYIDLGTTPVLWNDNAPQTFECWLNLATLDSHDTPVIATLQTSSGDTFNLWVGGSTTYSGEGLNIYNGGHFRITGVSSGLVSNWNHIAVAYNGAGNADMSNWRVFINGVPQTPTDPTGYWGVTHGVNWFGTDGIGDDRDSMMGRLDELRVCATARSPNWIWAEYMNEASNAVFCQYGAASTNVPLCFQSIEHEAGGHGVDFFTVSGLPYELRWKTNLITDTWHFYTNLIGCGGNAHVCFTNAAPQGFFQILVNP